ncbi:MAG: hypothetical protein ACI8QI_000955 [Limisphaerales bacterium]|jgi:hypothetical protein
MYFILLQLIALSLSPALSRWERELGQTPARLIPSPREKVAAGRMRVKPLGCFFDKRHSLIAGLEIPCPPQQ